MIGGVPAATETGIVISVSGNAQAQFLRCSAPGPPPFQRTSLRLASPWLPRKDYGLEETRHIGLKKQETRH